MINVYKSRYILRQSKSVGSLASVTFYSSVAEECNKRKYLCFSFFQLNLFFYQILTAQSLHGPIQRDMKASGHVIGRNANCLK